MSQERFGDLGVVDERELVGQMRDWRRGRADKNLGQAFMEAYIWVFAIVVVGAMLINALIQAQRDVAGCDSDGCIAARNLLPWATVAGLLAFTLAVCRLFGPIVASAAEGFWLMDAPVDRAKLLRRRLYNSLGIAFLAGAAFGALVAALTGSPLAAVGMWALAGGFGAFGLTAFAASQQSAERTWLTVALQWLVGLVAFVTMLALVGIAAGWLPVAPIQHLSDELALIVAVAGLLLGIVSSVLARARLRQIRRQRLTAGSALLGGLQGAAFALDFALMRDILVEHRAREKGHVSPTRGAGLGTRAIMLRDLQRLWRHPGQLVVLLASAVVPYALQALGVGQLNPTLSGLVLFVALIGSMNSLRVLTRTPGLQRCFPFSPGQLRGAAMVVPAGLAVMWALIVLPAFLGFVPGARLPVLDAVLTALLTAVAGLLGAVRWVSAKPASYSGPMVAVGVGAVPPGMMFSLFRGIDMVALITLPVVLGLPRWVGFLIALIVFSLLRSGLDREAMLEQQEEQRRLLEQERAKRRGGASATGKIKVQRNTRR